MKSLHHSVTPILRHSVTLSLLLLALCASGCASVYMTQSYKQEALRQTLHLRAQGGQLQAGVDLLDLTDPGYFSAWQAHPWKMAGATAVDLGAGIAAYSVYQNNASGKSESPGPTVPTVQAGRGDVYVIQGNNNTFNYSQEVPKE